MVEEILLPQPEVVATGRRTGRAELDPHAQEIHASEIEVTLKMGERSKEHAAGRTCARVRRVPGTNIVIGQPISHRIDHMLSGTRANIAIKLFGQGPLRAAPLGQQIEELVKAVPGAVDVASSSRPTFRS
jgi:Cu/Ag efflux pump CusA